MNPILERADFLQANPHYVVTHHFYLMRDMSGNNPINIPPLEDGEYIEFSISNIKNPTQDGHKVQAVEVRGLYGGKLMCEFRSRKRE
jgi:hypothetical protein